LLKPTELHKVEALEIDRDKIFCMNEKVGVQHRH
jgi:hypothetical protein